MKNINPDAIQSDMLSNKKHYYSDGEYLREKHRLAGDGFVEWSLQYIPSWNDAKILDAGGGWGRYVWTLLDEYGVIPSNVVLTDISDGMLKTAQAEAQDRMLEVSVAVNTLEGLPFQSDSFDIVMANKVLYHLSDIEQGIQEIARVLKPNGYLLATTNSDKITATIISLHYQALEKLNIPFTPEPPSIFSMENGGNLLEIQFQQIETHYYKTEQLIDNTSTIRATYENIGRYRNLLNSKDISESQKEALPNVVEEIAQEIIDRDGVLRSPGLMGVFVCRKS